MKADVQIIHVNYEGRGDSIHVGRLAYLDRRLYFEYDPLFKNAGLELSPFNLRLQDGAVEGDRDPFDGLHGLFNDSLPDGWGRLLLDRKLATLGIEPATLTPLDRLAYIGKKAVGALSFHPEYDLHLPRDAVRLDALAEEATSILEGDAGPLLDELLALGGSPGGARPKVLVGCDKDKKNLVHGETTLTQGYDHWMVKFRGGESRRGTQEPIDVGAIEYAYSLMAAEAGVDMPETHLFPARRGPGYFGVRRFERIGNTRVHVHSLCGLVNADHRIPSFTYEMLLRVTRALTKDQRQVDQMFRRMVFNVAAHNRDDHTKNFAFTMDANGGWSVSPAFDITYCAGPAGEHSMTIAGEGRHPTEQHLLKVARHADVDMGIAKEAMERVKDAVAKWPEIAARCGVARTTISDLSKKMGLKGATTSAAGKPRRATPKAPGLG